MSSTEEIIKGIKNYIDKNDMQAAANKIVNETHAEDKEVSDFILKQSTYKLHRLNIALGQHVLHDSFPTMRAKSYINTINNILNSRNVMRTIIASIITSLITSVLTILITNLF